MSDKRTRDEALRQSARTASSPPRFSSKRGKYEIIIRQYAGNEKQPGNDPFNRIEGANLACRCNQGCVYAPKQSAVRAEISRTCADSTSVKP